MGLCKCPKRRATNLFCFEHRVNVCEYCLVDVHEATYLSWLTDSDYDPKCLLCSEPLSSKETVRLKCLHNYHWTCLSSREGSLPEGTPSAAFKCPSCLDGIFPSVNQVSPVIDRLKEKLSSVNWGRAGLGLDRKPGLDIASDSAHHTPKRTFTVDIPFETSSQTTSRTKSAPAVSTEKKPLISQDADLGDVKYQKRHTVLQFRRWPRSAKRIVFVFILLGGFYLVLMMFGRDSEENDSMFDPHANPNIRVEASP